MQMWDTDTYQHFIFHEEARSQSSDHRVQITVMVPESIISKMYKLSDFSDFICQVTVFSHQDWCVC